MNQSVPPQAIQALRQRIVQMREEQKTVPQAVGAEIAIAELESLIRQLESGNGPRHP